MIEVDEFDNFFSQINVVELKQTELKMIVATRIDEIMKDKNMSKQEFSRLMNEKDSSSSRYFKGFHNFTLNTVAKIAHVLDVEVSELVIIK